MTSVVRFPVVAGIYGVSQLATKLMAMEAGALIGSWHVGNWVDYTHQVIRIRFNTFADGQKAKQACATWRMGDVASRCFMARIFRTPTEASAGVMNERLRYVLGTSLMLVIVAFIFALSFNYQ